MTLTGYFPDEQTHKDLLAAINRRFFDSKLTDELATAKGAPKDFATAAAAAKVATSKDDGSRGLDNVQKVK